jgi:hypothetical protein
MTWHLFSSDGIACANCGAEFIPFEPKQPCPRCETPVQQHSAFLDEVVAGLRIHKSEWGTFTSPAYFIGGRAENHFLWTCRILDGAEEQRREAGMEAAIDAWVNGIDWGEYLYLRPYFRRLATLAWEGLSKAAGDGEQA